MPEVTRNGEKNSSGADGQVASLDAVTYSVTESTRAELKAGWYEHKSHSSGFVSKIIFVLSMVRVHL